MTENNPAFATSKPWKLQKGAVQCLRDAAHAHAIQHEPNRAFPGVNIDRVYSRWAAYQRRWAKAA